MIQNINYINKPPFHSAIFLLEMGSIEKRMHALLFSVVEPWSVTFTLDLFTIITKIYDTITDNTTWWSDSAFVGLRQLVSSCIYGT